MRLRLATKVPWSHLHKVSVWGIVSFVSKIVNSGAGFNAVPSLVLVIFQASHTADYSSRCSLLRPKGQAEALGCSVSLPNCGTKCCLPSASVIESAVRPTGFHKPVRVGCGIHRSPDSNLLISGKTMKTGCTEQPS